MHFVDEMLIVSAAAVTHMQDPVPLESHCLPTALGSLGFRDLGEPVVMRI